MSENTLITNIDNNDNNDIIIDNIDNIEKINIEPQPKKKQIRKPLSEEQKERKRESLAKARQIRTERYKNKVTEQNEFKERVKTICNLNEIIDRKVKESIPVKEPKIKPPKPSKEEKQAKRIELIDKIVTEKLSQYKPPERKISDLELIKRLF